MFKKASKKLSNKMIEGADEYLAGLQGAPVASLMVQIRNNMNGSALTQFDQQNNDSLLEVMQVIDANGFEITQMNTMPVTNKGLATASATITQYTFILKSKATIVRL